MRGAVNLAAILMAACAAPALAQPNGEGTITPFIELQSGPLTPGLAIEESRRPVHQIRVLVDADMKRGTLVLDANVPEFDEFGNLTGGILTPQVRGEGGPAPPVELKCVLEFLKEDGDGWRLYRLTGPEIRTPFGLATRGAIGDGGPARVLVLDLDKEVKTVVNCTRYGLVVP